MLEAFLVRLARLIAPLFAHAAPPPTSFIPGTGELGTAGSADYCDFMTGKLHFGCIVIYIGYLIKFLIIFAGGLLLVGIILAGYKYAIGAVTAAGKEEGKKQLTGAIIGFSVVILSYLLVDTIIRALT